MLQITPSAAAALLLLSSSLVTATTFFSETFDDAETVPSRWVVSSVKDDYGSWGISAGKFSGDAVTSKGLKTMDNAKFYSISVPLDSTANTADSDFIIQFSVKHEQSIDCGGGYVKLLPPGFKPAEFDGESKYGM
jgi:calreticulin